ncbi:uncharacterized protein LOC113311476 [Papaver somniferum]|uniref:uncharacterized protein LOC113311476 n=1 Tax=Papaver somniferum TaxID=3469 RepID=UPI000E703AA6|nr:uncharacterized protein LOC113311476 [Papaver somniferum]
MEISWRIPSSQRTSKAQVWVRLPGLGLEFRKEEILFKICKEIGTPIKIDVATANCEVGYYVNVLVEIDFAHSIPNKIWIDTKFGGFFQDISIPYKTKVDNARGENKQFTTPEKQQQIPFDICDISERAGEDSVVNTIHETQVIKLSTGNNILQKGKSSLLVCEEGEIDNEVVIKEVPNVLTPKKANSLESTTINYVDGKTGQVSNEVVKVISWSKIVEKEMVSNTTSSSNATSPTDPVKVTKQFQANNKYNFRKNQGKIGAKNPPPPIK